MTLQNRVLPTGELAAEAWRGTLMGNRGGRIHDPDTRTLLRRRHASRRWICCVLTFKNRQRTVMGRGYTEVFFLDEVSAFAAGHRPCFECQRARADEFQKHWQEAFALKTKPAADIIDRKLHEERTRNRPIVANAVLSSLPNGTMIWADGASYALNDETFLKWSGHGYSTSD
nr:hypothetical protein [Rhizobiaceae bacterium]